VNGAALPHWGAVAQKTNNLSINENKFRSTVLDKRLNFPSVLSTGNYIAKSLSYEQASEVYTFKECRKESVTKVYEVVD
jgi:hypothetical protein